MKNSSQSKFALFVMLGSLISVAALTFVFTQRGAAQDIKPIQRPLATNSVQEKQAAQIRELQDDVAALKNQISALRLPLARLKALDEDHVSKADFDKLKADSDKQIFETKLRLTTLEKDYKGHTHENLKLGVSGNNVIVLDPNKVEKLKFPLSGPVQH
jgi:cell division protein FtsB